MTDMTTTLPLTLYLAQAIGLYLVLLGASVFIAPQRWERVIDEFVTSAALPLITGGFAFVLGVVLIRVHCVLTDPLAIAVTAAGWAALAKGAMLILFPQLSMRLGQWSVRYFRVWAVVVLILGILLGLAGLTGHADATRLVSQQSFPVPG
jgi:uncharacterized protein YjeT (DUF2065 family)